MIYTPNTMDYGVETLYLPQEVWFHIGSTRAPHQSVFARIKQEGCAHMIERWKRQVMVYEEPGIYARKLPKMKDEASVKQHAHKLLEQLNNRVMTKQLMDKPTWTDEEHNMMKHQRKNRSQASKPKLGVVLV